MKILRITVNNIASLAGTHTVDFTKEPLRSAGLYSISGATGAGKSTLLDALCLALYDATPRLQCVGRLEELRQGQNKQVERQDDTRSLLRRGAADGFAEVAFMGVDQQAWTSRWSVRRGHKKADGKLQSVEMTLYRGHIEVGTNGQVEAGGKKLSVLAAIVEKIGLTFEQFTRAVLLAQNDFAAFLKADDRQRAEILQALTGTELFEKISQEIHRRATEEKKQYELIDTQLTGNSPFSADDRAAAQTALQSAQERLDKSTAALKTFDTFLEWFRVRTERENNVQKANQQLLEATNRRNASETQRIELQSTELIAREAKPLRTAHELALQAVLNRSLASKKAVDEAQNLETDHEDLFHKIHQVSESLEQAKLEQIALEPHLSRARCLDTLLVPATTRFDKALTLFDETRVSQVEVISTFDDAKLRQSTLIAKQSKRESSKSTLQRWAPLAKEASTWLDRMDRVIDGKKSMEASLQSFEDIRVSYLNSEKTILQASSTKKETENVFLATDKLLLESIDFERQFNPDNIALQRSSLEVTLQIVTDLKSTLVEISSQHKKLSDLKIELETLTIAQKQDNFTRDEWIDKQLPASVLAAEVSAQQLVAIQNAIDDDAKRLRLGLQDGKECPVCGSVEHPYSEYEPDADATAVKAAKKSVKQFEKQRDLLKSKITELEAGIKYRESQILKCEADIQRTTETVDSIHLDNVDHAEVRLILELPSHDDRLHATEMRLAETKRWLEQITVTEKAYREAMKTTAESRIAIEVARKSATEAQLSFAQSEKSHAVLEQQQGQAKIALSNSQAAYAEFSKRLNDVWAILPDSQVAFHHDPVPVRDQFESNMFAFNHIEEELQKGNLQLQELATEIGPLEESVRHTEKQFSRCETEYNAAREDLERLKNERSQIFGGALASEIESRVILKRAEIEKEFSTLSQRKNNLEKLLASANANKESATLASLQTNDSLQQAQSALDSWLAQFANQTSRWLSLLDLDEILARDDLWIQGQRESLKQLNDAVVNTKGALDVYHLQLKSHLDMQPTEEIEPNVFEASHRERIEHQQAKESLEAARLVLLSDDQRITTNADLVKQLQERRTAAEPWLQLNDVIGSADGAKFRIIAQRKTLDVLLRYANHQLRQLAIRYRLERLPESLNLIVIDCDMEDERRSIHSLSGGESFLVSLALALGLASLTSNRVRIESLFIDEGFGSLDPSTLNIAMGALMQLESQGRKVGVISHVAEMSDLIPVQVKVIKGRGGKSSIEIPGMTAS